MTILFQDWINRFDYHEMLRRSDQWWLMHDPWAFYNQPSPEGMGVERFLSR